MNVNCTSSPSGKRLDTEYIDTLYCDCRVEDINRALDELDNYLNLNSSASISRINRDKLNHVLDKMYETHGRLKQRLYS